MATLIITNEIKICPYIYRYIMPKKKEVLVKILESLRSYAKKEFNIEPSEKAINIAVATQMFESFVSPAIDKGEFDKWVEMEGNYPFDAVLIMNNINAELNKKQKHVIVAHLKRFHKVMKM